MPLIVRSLRCLLARFRVVAVLWPLMLLQKGCGLADDAVECIATVAEVEQELNALPLDYHASDPTRLVLHIFCGIGLALHLLVLLDLTEHVLVQVVAQILLLVLFARDLVELIHWNIHQYGIHGCWLRLGRLATLVGLCVGGCLLVFLKMKMS